MTGLRNGNDLATSSFSVFGALDDTGQVKHLDVGAVILHLAWDGGEGGELVCGGCGGSIDIT